MGKIAHERRERTAQPWLRIITAAGACWGLNTAASHLEGKQGSGSSPALRAALVAAGGFWAATDGADLLATMLPSPVIARDLVPVTPPTAIMEKAHEAGLDLARFELAWHDEYIKEFGARSASAQTPALSLNLGPIGMKWGA